jgi:hypothetical protein
MEKFFHTVEKTARIFPRHGKNLSGFSTLWKNFRQFFHARKTFFHSVENRREGASRESPSGEGGVFDDRAAGGAGAASLLAALAAGGWSAAQAAAQSAACRSNLRALAAANLAYAPITAGSWPRPRTSKTPTPSAGTRSQRRAGV